jgi:ankyrin repeat protein
MKRPSKAALFAAAKHWDAAEARAILANAPELVSATDPKGRSAIHIACAVKPGGSSVCEPYGIETVSALLDAGSDLESIVAMNHDEGDFRANPLWYAVVRGENLPLVRFLVRLGADASYSLWAAVWRDDAELCRELLKGRPRLDLKAHGETPIFYAARLRRLNALDLLIDTGANPAIKDSQGRDAVEIARHRGLPEPFLDRLPLLKERCTPG